MSTTQNLLWIALPNGVRSDGGEKFLRLSAFATPRLRSDEGETLSTFPDFLDWPELMLPEHSSFTVVVDDGTEVEAIRVGDQPEANLWRALFTHEIPVRPFEFDDHSNRPIVSFPALTVLKYVEKSYSTIASRAPLDLPLVERHDQGDDGGASLDNVFRELVELRSGRLDGNRERELSAALEAGLARARAIANERRQAGTLDGPLIEPPGIFAAGGASDAFHRAMMFHYRPREAVPAPMPNAENARAHFEAEVDFHQMLSALGDYPMLLRRLGLIIDLEIPFDAIPLSSGPLPDRKLRIVPTWSSAFPIGAPGQPTPWTADYSPWTAYSRTAPAGLDLFEAMPRLGESSAGFWVPPPDVDVTQLDVDGAALKVINMAGSIARSTVLGGPRALDAPDAAGIPTLRTGGVSLVRPKRAHKVNESFNRSKSINQMLSQNPPQLAELHAEDLIQGYRLDVFEGRTGKWSSLHGRIGTYNIVSLPDATLELPDEGFTQLSFTSPARDPAQPPDPASEIYLHENLFTWDGWSLSAPRLGKSISRSPRAPAPDDPDSQLQRVNNTAITRLGLETEFRAQPASLPRLRFGDIYQFRVRTVDLAGNGTSLDEANIAEDHISANTKLPRVRELRYRRFEPVDPPVLVPRQIYSPEGDPTSPSANAYAEGESLERLVIRSNFNQSAVDYAVTHPSYRDVNERHLAPPKASLQLIETHGLLDDALNAKSLGLTDEQVRAKIAEIYALAARESGSIDDASLPSVRMIRTATDPASEQGFAVHTEEQLIVPYLPDPLAIGVMFEGLPGLPVGEHLAIKFEGDAWYKPLPFRLRIEEGFAPPAFDEATRVLTIALQQAAIIRVRIRSMFGGDLETMGLWQWLVDAHAKGEVSDDRMSELKQWILESRHWMFTPFRELTLMHAVQQPLIEPKLNIQVSPRSFGATACDISGLIVLHVPSTSKLDLLAEWTEPRDDLTKDEPDEITARAHVSELPVSLDGQAIDIAFVEAEDALRIEHDRVLIFNTAHGRIARHNWQNVLDDPQANHSLPERKLLNDRINLAAKVSAHEFGDTKYRHVTYRVDATSRFREYYASGVTALPANITRTSQAIERDILSSARPAAPRALYALPTMGWTQSSDAEGTTVSTRKGGGLRLYLERPWWTSGAGELLAVVLSGLPDPTQPSYAYSSFWGQDPIWLSPGLPVPHPDSFRNSRGSFTHVRLSELPGDANSVTVVLFEVKYDTARKLWYCDLDLATDDFYFPFIRLAVARFQPNSIQDLRLSSIVIIDLIQTVPNRTTTLIRDAGGPGVHSVSLSGVTYRAQHLPVEGIVAASSSVDFIVQARLPEVEDETLGWQDATSVTVLIPNIREESGSVTWQTMISTPPELVGTQLRILVQEFETVPLASPSAEQEYGRRIVHIDTILL
jgi:hypothetical protein